MGGLFFGDTLDTLVTLLIEMPRMTGGFTKYTKYTQYKQCTQYTQFISVYTPPFALSIPVNPLLTEISIGLIAPLQHNERCTELVTELKHITIRTKPDRAAA
jgi:hypothetical protein